MKQATFSIRVFATYITALSSLLLVAPNWFLVNIFQDQPTDAVWIRIFAIVLFAVSLYYWTAAQKAMLPFYKMSTWGRVLVAIGLASLIATKMLGPQYIIFPFLDASGGIWTYIALKKAGLM